MSQINFKKYTGMTLVTAKWVLMFCLCGIAFSSQAAMTEGKYDQAAASNPYLIDRIVAIVNDDVITQTELSDEVESIKKQLRAQRATIPSDDLMYRQILERIVLVRIQLQLANARHIRIDDISLNRALENIAAQNNMDLDRLRLALQAEGLDYTTYRERVRNELTISRLQQRLVQNGINVTDQEVDDFLNNQSLQDTSNDEFRLQHILFVVPEAASAEKIKEVKEKAGKVMQEIKTGKDFTEAAIAYSDGQQALEGGNLGWRKLSQLPTIFADVAINMQEGEVSELIRSPSGFHIIKLAEKRRNEQQHIVNQTKARHILIKPNELVSPQDALVRMDQLKQRIEAGESFADIATAHSDDTGSAANGGDLGWINPGVMVKEFEEALEKLDVGEISEPVKTRFGLHLIQVLDRREHDSTVEFQRNRARDIIRQRKYEPALDNWLRRIRDEAFVELRI